MDWRKWTKHLPAAGLVFSAIGGVFVGYRVWKGSSVSLIGSDVDDVYAGLDGLDSDFRGRLEDTLSTLESMGYEPMLYETLRTEERGEYLKEKGVSQLGSRSLHVTGLAADIIDGRSHPDRSGQIVGWGSWSTDSSVSTKTAGDYTAAHMADEFWDALASVAEENGLEAGHNWVSFVDSPHIQLSGKAVS